MKYRVKFYEPITVLVIKEVIIDANSKEEVINKWRNEEYENAKTIGSEVEDLCESGIRSITEL